MFKIHLYLLKTNEGAILFVCGIDIIEFEKPLKYYGYSPLKLSESRWLTRFQQLQNIKLGEIKNMSGSGDPTDPVFSSRP